MQKLKINIFKTKSNTKLKHSYKSNRGNKILYYNKYDNQFLLFDVLKKKETFFKIKSKKITEEIIKNIFIKNFTFILDDFYEWRTVKNEININYFPKLQLIYYNYKYGRIKN